MNSQINMKSQAIGLHPPSSLNVTRDFDPNGQSLYNKLSIWGNKSKILNTNT